MASSSVLALCCVSLAFALSAASVIPPSSTTTTTATTAAADATTTAINSNGAGQGHQNTAAHSNLNPTSNATTTPTTTTTTAAAAAAATTAINSNGVGQGHQNTAAHSNSNPTSNATTTPTTTTTTAAAAAATTTAINSNGAGQGHQNTAAHSNSNPTSNATTTTTTTTTTTAATTTTIADSTTTAAAAPQPPFTCYDCNSGNPFGWVNYGCDVSGTGIEDWYLQSGCQTFCFSSVGLYPAGGVSRGCASNLHLSDTLTEGCFLDEENNRHVCLCSGDQCNVENLTDLSEYYMALSANAV